MRSSQSYTGPAALFVGGVVIDDAHGNYSTKALAMSDRFFNRLGDLPAKLAHCDFADRRAKLGSQLRELFVLI